MTISIDIPPEIEAELRRDGADPAAALKEAALVELYRGGRLSHHELGQALRLTRFETDAVLKRHGVTEDLQTPEEYDADMARLRELQAPR